jgi:hypothetical protein
VLVYSGLPAVAPTIAPSLQTTSTYAPTLGSSSSQTTTSTAESTTSSPPPTSTVAVVKSSRKDSNTGLIIGLVVGLLFMLALILGALLYIRRRNRAANSKPNANASWYIKYWTPSSNTPIRTSTIASHQYEQGRIPQVTTEYAYVVSPTQAKNPPISPPRRPPRPESLSESLMDTMRTSPPPQTREYPYIISSSSTKVSPTWNDSHEMTVFPVQRSHTSLSLSPLKVVKRAFDEAATQQSTYRQYQHESLDKKFPKSASKLADDGHESDCSGNSAWTDETRHTTIQDSFAIRRERERQKALADLLGMPNRETEGYRRMGRNDEELGSVDLDKNFAGQNYRGQKRQEEEKTRKLHETDKWHQGL